MINSAVPELLELAEAMRGPEWRLELEAAIAAAHNAGWTFTRTLIETARLLGDEDGSPRDLTAAVRGPVTSQADPGYQAAVKAEARADLERIRSEARAAEAGREAEREGAA